MGSSGPTPGGRSGRRDTASVIVSWSALWDKILSDGIGQHFGIYRGLLIILAGLLFAAAFAAWRLNPLEIGAKDGSQSLGGENFV